jgi:pyruvate kinase
MQVAMDTLTNLGARAPRSGDASAPSNAADVAELEALIAEIAQVREHMLRVESAGFDRTHRAHPTYESSARNLLHYCALRSRDLRALQERLAARGLSSLGRAEAHVLCTVDAVLAVLHRLLGRNRDASVTDGRAPDFARGRALLDEHADALLGACRPNRRVRILVTLPSEAASDPSLVRGLLERGMDCARINCAHDDASTWSAMLANLRHSSSAVGRRCRVMMDLAGPKLRTGPIEPGASVIKIRPDRDELGRVVRPARVWLTGMDDTRPAPADADAILPITDALLARLEAGDRVELEESRGSRRTLDVVLRVRGGAWAELVNTCYAEAGARLLRHGGRKRRVRGCVGPLPAREGTILLRTGDRLVLTSSSEPGRGAQHDARGHLLAPARIGCTPPEVLADVRIGESAWLDDGRIGCVVRSVSHEGLVLEVTRARPGGEQLRADKGINLPDSALQLPALTGKDVTDLAFAVQHADAVALSFVNRPEDVDELEARLAELGRPDMGIVLKIETRRAFEHLPSLLLASMKSARDGVMIARGDLAVECGWERLAEVQEEILWMCEAAHVPVIWATQVLEGLAKDGRPTRAEITDAAMSERAECVMLNKGPHVEAAVAALDDILQRMQAHQRKKSAMLRPLRLAEAVAR